jgi:hypothetical protein
MAGVASFLFVDLYALIKLIPVPEGQTLPELPPPMLFKLVSVIQPAVITTLAVAIGCWLSPGVGLHSPATQAAMTAPAQKSRNGLASRSGQVANWKSANTTVTRSEKTIRIACRPRTPSIPNGLGLLLPGSPYRSTAPSHVIPCVAGRSDARTWTGRA